MGFISSNNYSAPTPEAQAAQAAYDAQSGVLSYVKDGTPYDANGTPINMGGSTFVDPATGQMYGANGNAVDMGQYNTGLTVAPNTPGGFFGGVDQAAAAGLINQDPTGGGLGNFIRANGWMVPLALAGGVAAGGGLAGALGAEAAGGAGAIDSTAAALGGAGGGGAFVPTAGASFAIDPLAAYTTAGATGASNSGGSLLGDASLQDLATQNADAAAQEAAQTAQYNTAPIPNGTSLSDILKTANQVKQGLSTAQSLASLLSPSSALTGAASKLAAGANPSGTATTALTRGNLNPFTQEQNFQVSAPKSLAALLRQG